MTARSVGDPAEPGPAREAAAHEAVLASVSPDRLLPGEDADSNHVDDARHWITVYSELLGLKQGMLAVIHEQPGELGPEARAEIDRTDKIGISAESERFARRLGFWRRRLDELSDRAPDPPTS